MGLVAACARPAAKAERALAVPVVVVPPPPVPEATSAPSAVASAKPPPRPRLEGFDVIADAVWKRCEVRPTEEEGVTTSTLKLAHAHTNACIDRHVVAALDEVLLPLKAVGSPRFHALMVEEARFKRFSDQLAQLVEATSELDESGVKATGSGYDCDMLACWTSSSEERLYYARALEIDDAAALAARVEALQKAGAITSKKSREWAKVAARGLAGGFPDPGNLDPWDRVLDHEDWSTIARAVTEVEAGSGALATSTCDDFPGLAEALGGADACRRKVSRYYLAHCSFDEE